MKRNNSLLSFGIVFFLLMLVGSQAQATEYTQTQKKSFKVKKGALLNINTEFSEVKAYNWDKSEISVEATITVDASSESKANDRFDRIDIKLDGNPDLVNIISRIESGFFNKNNNNIHIEFLVYYPQNIRLKTNMQFGKAFFENIDGDTDIDNEYSGFNAQNLSSTENQIQIAFGSLALDKITQGRIEVEYGTCQIEEAEKLNLRTSFSGDVSVEKVDELILKSAYDKIYIGQVNNISGSAEFSGFNLDILNESMDMKASYGSFKVRSISNDFSSIILKSEFCALKLYVEPTASFQFSADVELGSFNYPKENVTVTSFQKDITDLRVEGYFGSNEKAKGTMRFTVENASANINLK